MSFSRTLTVPERFFIPSFTPRGRVLFSHGGLRCGDSVKGKQEKGESERYYIRGTGVGGRKHTQNKKEEGKKKETESLHGIEEEGAAQFPSRNRHLMFFYSRFIPFISYLFSFHGALVARV